MRSSVSAQLAVALVGILISAAFVRLVFADVGTSTNFRNSQSINDFGGQSTSSSFSSITTGGQIVTGESTSSSFTLESGFQYFDSFTPRSQNWRWYDDETNETPTSALEDENVAPSSVFNNNIIKLRVSVAEIADIGQSGTKFKLQYSTSTDFSSGGYGVVESGGACSGASVWCYADGSGADNGVITTELLSDANACSGSVGDGCGTHNESGTSISTFTHKRSAVTEYEFTIMPSGAAPNTTYFFRLVDTVASSTVPTNTGETYPSLSTEGGTLTFLISGIATSTSAAGVTTDIGTTPEVVPFGALPIGASLTAAHNLVVSTNAAAGYQVYTYQAQGFLGDQGAEITPITGTNQSPTPWSSGCLTSATGCYGYHTDDAVLLGGSARFAADDTYARFTQQLNEISFHGSPIENATTTVVYKIEAHTLQAAQAYSTNVTYIVVPTF